MNFLHIGLVLDNICKCLRVGIPALRSRLADVSRFGGSARCFFFFLGGYFALKERKRFDL